MKKLTAAELAKMQTTQVESLMDTCVIMTYTQALDDYGAEVTTWPDGATVDCGLNMTPSRESRQADMNVERIDATIRLPLNTVVKSSDKIRITHRFGVAITALVFEVIGAVRRGPSGLQIDLQAINP